MRKRAAKKRATRKKATRKVVKKAAKTTDTAKFTGQSFVVISDTQSESLPVTKTPQGEVDMEITNFTYSGPDSDGDISWDLNATIKNDTEHVVELIKTSSLVLNADNICVGGSYDDEHDEFIDPGDSVSMNLNPGYIKEPVFGGQLDKNKMIVNAALFRREFNKLGEMKVPEDYTDCTFFETHTNVGGIVDIMGATCKRQEPDDDGDVSVGVEVGVRNVTDSYIEKVSLKMVVRDEEDSNIEESEDYYHLAPHAARVFSMSMYAKPGKLRNSTIRLSAAVFFPVGYKTVEATAEEGEE